MGDRLSDEELQSIAWYPRQTPLETVMSMANELRARRAADLTAEDRENLAHLQWEARTFLLGGDRYDPSEYERRCKVVRALSALSKILKDGT
jgi:hypothetical protein